MYYAPIRSGHTPSPRQIQVEDCLLENLQRLPYNSISISELCRQVGISRRAFYLYFKDKEECLYSLIERKYQNLLLKTATAQPENATDLDACITLLTIFKENSNFFDLMVRNRRVDHIVYRIILYAANGGECFLPTREVTTAQIDPDLAACLICSQIALMLRWHEQSYETPVEEMARKLLKLTRIALP